MSDERLERITARLRRAPAVDEAVRKAIAEHELPEVLAAAVTQDAADAVRADRAPLVELVPPRALEAIVQRFGRPPMLIRDDRVELEELVDFPAGTDALVRAAERCIPSVGRVEFLNHASAWGGTGWVIDRAGDARVVATNRHVAALVARRTGSGKATFMRSPTTGVRYGANIDFGEEAGSDPALARPFTVTEVIYLAEDAAPDVALLRIVGDDLPDALELADDEAEPGQVVATIGYPAFDTRNDVADQARYFRDLYEVKRFAPGVVMQALSGRTTLRHDCTTLGGNSGSPLLRLEDRTVVGLHFSGRYGVENAAVGVRTLRDLVRSGSRPTFVPVALGTSTAVTADTEGAADGLHTPADLADRPGYDPGFLGGGLDAPWPGLPEDVAADLARPSDELAGREGELRYTHFGVRFSTTRRQPLMTAVNIDGSSLVKIKRSGDKWFADGRIPAGIQLTKADYSHPEVDRGHMVRRQDPNWDPAARPGRTSDLAERANLDTFHYTNAAPQHADLNQGAQLWLGLEDHILDSAATGGFRACVFTGPVNRDDDEELEPGVLLPREFWKVVVMATPDGGALHATAYVLSQGDMIRDLLEQRDRTEANEGFVFGPYRTFQVAVRDLAAATGYDLSAYEAADPLGRVDGGQEATGAPAFRPLERLEDAVV